MCAHRLDMGLEPACVTVCPTEAILVGDLKDPASKVAQTISREPVQVRQPEKNTRPGVFYKGAHQATLDPLAARRPDGGLFAWATQGAPDPQLVTSGHPGRTVSSAAALLSYDVPHQAPWGWRVSLYTWTKSIAAGSFAVPVALAFAGVLAWGNAAVRWAAPVLALAFLAVTGGLLIADLKHPMRFHLIFTRHHWRSWLVRGAFILGGYGAAVALYLVAALTGSMLARQVLGGLGLPLAAACRRLHRVPVRPGQGARHVAEPAASPAPGGAGHAGGRRGHAAAAGLAGARARGNRRRGDPGRRGGRPPGAGRRRDHAAARHGARPAGHRRDDQGQVPRPVRPGNDSSSRPPSPHRGSGPWPPRSPWPGCSATSTPTCRPGSPCRSPATGRPLRGNPRGHQPGRARAPGVGRAGRHRSARGDLLPGREPGAPGRVPA